MAAGVNINPPSCSPRQITDNVRSAGVGAARNARICSGVKVRTESVIEISEARDLARCSLELAALERAEL